MLAKAWERPLVFVRHLDLEIARATASIFKPAVPVTTEGLTYALTGMVFALVCYHWGLKRGIAAIKSSRVPRQPKA
jgi:hypothetical protein